MLCISSIEFLRFKAKKNEFVMFMKSFELVVYLYDLCGYCLQQLNVEFFLHFMHEQTRKQVCIPNYTLYTCTLVTRRFTLQVNRMKIVH